MPHLGARSSAVSFFFSPSEGVTPVFLATDAGVGAADLAERRIGVARQAQHFVALSVAAVHVVGDRARHRELADHERQERGAVVLPARPAHDAHRALAYSNTSRESAGSIIGALSTSSTPYSASHTASHHSTEPPKRRSQDRRREAFPSFVGPRLCHAGLSTPLGSHNAQQHP